MGGLGCLGGEDSHEERNSIGLLGFDNTHGLDNLVLIDLVNAEWNAELLIVLQSSLHGFYVCDWLEYLICLFLEILSKEGVGRIAQVLRRI